MDDALVPEAAQGFCFSNMSAPTNSSMNLNA